MLVLNGGAAAITGPEVDVSQLRGPQTNPTITVDPRNEKILLAGSNSLLEGTERVYSSTDGGVTWSTSTLTPPVANLRSTCPSDPGVAIDRTGRQYFSFDRSTPCTSDAPSRVYVSSRPGPEAAWSKPVLVARLGRARFDDKPAIAVDAVSGEPAREPHLRRLVARVAPGRLLDRAQPLRRPGPDVVAAGEGQPRGRRPHLRQRRDREERHGLRDLDGHARYTVKIARSTDGGEHFEPEQRAAAFTVVTIPHCGIGIVIRADPRSCIQANPIVSVDTSGGRYTGRVYVSYTGTDFTGDQGAALSTFDSRLRPIAGYPVLRHHRVVARAPGRQLSDQFWPQSAVDRSDGSIWLCFYDTHGDPTRTKRSSSVRHVSERRQDLDAAGARRPRPPLTRPSPALASTATMKGLAVANGVAHPIWTDSRRLACRGDLHARRVTAGRSRLAPG